MTQELIITLGKESVKIALMLSAPMLLFGLVVGLLVSIFQAVTQIQEMTLAFIPKILAVILALVIFFPWMLRLMIDFTGGIITNIPMYIG
ncbi:MAG: flagellar biosynthesis protein FliQ, partial [Candidatus Tectomicrobia bacterium]|nr:flagellar biosynthesis protein FliQ [Candidatus Tectomicrobia bacterium]